MHSSPANEFGWKIRRGRWQDGCEYEPCLGRAVMKRILLTSAAGALFALSILAMPASAAAQGARDRGRARAEGEAVPRREAKPDGEGKAPARSEGQRAAEQPRSAETPHVVPPRVEAPRAAAVPRAVPRVVMP